YMVAHVFNSRVIEIIMMTCPEASMSIESPVPFADNVRAISKLTQILRQEFLVKWQSSGLRTFENLNYSSRNIELKILLYNNIYHFLTCCESNTYAVLHSSVNGIFARH
ncbi:hypothetical protein ALC60_14434, partial [Trachymyrmex zeteki]